MQTVTATGRLSSRNPNFQNQPRGNTFPIRKVISSRFEGGKVMEIDYAQLEFRTAVFLAQDKQGMEAAKKVASILKPGKAKIVTLPNGYKDANDMLVKGKYKEFTSAWWDAKVFTPGGIIRVSEKKDQFLDRPRKESIPYPWEGLNQKLYGLRQGE